MIARVIDLLLQARPLYVGLALGVYSVSLLLVAFRWRTALGGVRANLPPVPMRPLVLGSLASAFVNNVTPVVRMSGEACRVVVLVRLRLASLSQATASAAYERLTEIPAVAVLALIALRVVGRIPSRWLVAAAGLVLAALVAARWAVPRVWRRLAARWSMLESVAIAPSALVATTFLSGGVWVLDVVRLRLVAAAFRAPIGLADAAALSAIIVAAGWVPSIGGLGAVEGGLFAGLVAVGVPAADAIAITSVERTISYGISTAAGFGALTMLGGRSLWSAVRGRAATVEASA